MSGAPQLTILHISDPHFGPENVFDQEPPDKANPSLIDTLMTDLTRQGIAGPAICCVTGDLTQTSEDKEYAQAATQLQKLASMPLVGGLQNLFVIPGNHDVKWVADGPFARWASWRNFYRPLYPSAVEYDSDVALPAAVYDRADDLGAIIATLNSSVFVQQSDPRERQRGRLGNAQLDRFVQELSQIAADRLQASIRVALVHHHPVLIPLLKERIATTTRLRTPSSCSTSCTSSAFTWCFTGTSTSP